ncbi:MAG: class I SAM-dependent methyltransferase [Azonexus sp.]
MRGLEGLEPTTGWLYGEAPKTLLAIAEHGVRLGIDIAGGHKTGFYLDQRENRLFEGSRPARKSSTASANMGGFSLQALAGGAANVLSIDSSGPALEQAQANLALNPQLPAARAEWLEADVFQALRDFRKVGRQFDLVVLDPPKFVSAAAHAERN